MYLFNTVLTSPSGQPMVWWQNKRKKERKKKKKDAEENSEGVDSWTGGEREVGDEMKREGEVGNGAERRHV